MQFKNTSLPDPVKQFVDGQVGQGRCSSGSECVREPIGADERRKAEEALEAAPLEGLDGPESALTPEGWTYVELNAKVHGPVYQERPSNSG